MPTHIIEKKLESQLIDPGPPALPEGDDEAEPCWGRGDDSGDRVSTSRKGGQPYLLSGGLGDRRRTEKCLQNRHFKEIQEEVEKEKTE